MALKTTKRKLGTKLDEVLFGIPENRSKFMRTGQKNPAAKRRAIYRAGFQAGTSARKNPTRDISEVLAQLERTKLFKEAAAGDLAVVREFYLAGYHDGMGERNPKRCAAVRGNPVSVLVDGREVYTGSSQEAAQLAARLKSEGHHKVTTAQAATGAKHGWKKNPRPNGLYAPAEPGEPSWGVRFGGDWNSTSGNFKTRKGAAAFAKAQKRLAKKMYGQIVTARVVRNPGRVKRNPRNPLDTSQEAYEGFHGEKPKGSTTVQEREHFHTHVWEIGRLVMLKIQLPSDRRQPGLSSIVEIEFEYEGKNPARLTANEKRNQMFVDGGDQSVNLKTFGVETRHEKELLGYLKEAWYFTDKKHLGNQGGRAVYKHKLGEEGGELPAVVYRTLDKKLEIVGGSYTIPNEGVRN